MTRKESCGLIDLINEGHQLVADAREQRSGAADADQRSLTSLIEKLLTEHLRKGGYLNKKGR